MKDLPNISPKDGFDKEVMLKAWLQKLDKPAVPANFDEQVLKSAKAGTPWGTIVTAVGAVLALVLAGLYWQSLPNTVDVTYVPQSPLPVVDLYDLPPAPVAEDMRYQVVEELPPVEPYGVAGY